MDIMKFIPAWLLLAALPLFSQGEVVQKAFEASYQEETKGNYFGARNAIADVYAAESYEMNLRLGWLHYLLKDYSGSEGYYRRAVELKPFSVEAKFGFVKPLSALEKWNEVLKQYQEILKIYEMNEQANYWIASLYYNRKDYKNAIYPLERVINLYPFDYSGTLLLGWAYLQNGQSSDAKILFGKVLLMNPGDASALEGLKKTN
jgi:tetratricopeptide (TPR) repeat protein